MNLLLSSLKGHKLREKNTLLSPSIVSGVMGLMGVRCYLVTCAVTPDLLENRF